MSCNHLPLTTEHLHLMRAEIQRIGDDMKTFRADSCLHCCNSRITGRDTGIGQRMICQYTIRIHQCDAKRTTGIFIPALIIIQYQ